MSDLRLERLLGRVLQAGVTTSSIGLAIGLALALAFPGAQPPVYVIHAGLIILMATPVTRVVVSVTQYVAERDWPFVAMTTTVLVLLLGSLVAALWG